jgi:hypothetical protein
MKTEFTIMGIFSLGFMCKILLDIGEDFVMKKIEHWDFKRKQELYRGLLGLKEKLEK